MKKYIIILLAAVLIMFPSAGFSQSAQDLGTNYDVTFLTPGHYRTVTYNLDSNIFDNFESFHVSMLFTLGSGQLSFGTSRVSEMPAYSMFFTAGFMGLTPIFDYSWSTGSISQQVAMPDIGFGMLITFVGWGIYKPVTMSTTFSLN